MEIKKTSSKIMGKKILALMLTVVMVTGLLPPMTMPVQADGEVYGVLQSDGNVYVTNEGNTAPTTTVITDKKTVTHLYAAKGVTTIAAGAFYMCDKLISIDLPAVTSIGNSAFLGCTELTTIDLPAVNTIGNSAFLGCFELTAIDLPEVVVISDNAFNSCKNLTTVKLPRVTSISNNAFKSCTSFDNLTVGVTPPTVGTDVFDGCLCTNLTIDGGNTPAAVEAYENAGDNDTWYGWRLSVTHYPLTVVGGAGSGNYGKDTTVTITAAHLDDGQYFKEWTVQQGDVILADPTAATTNFTMPGKTVEVTANYEHIPEIYTITYATNGINVIGSMTSDEFTEDVAKVLQTNVFIRDGYSFKNWNTSADGTGTAYADGASFTATANTTLYAQWTETTPAVAGYGVLRKDGVIYETNVGNTKTDGAVITDKKTVTHLYAADDVTEIKADMFFNYDKLTTVDLPAVTSIGNEAFYKCEALTTVNMLKVTSIGDNTFAGCSRLTTVNLPVATSIGFEAFLTCTNLTKLDLPAVTSIAEKAFSWCDGLTEVNLPLVTSIGVGAFYTCGHLTTVDLPMVTSLGDSAFYGCDTLANLTVGATPPTSVGTNPFEGCSRDNLTIDGSNTPDNVKKYEDADSSSPQGYWYGWALPYSLTINNGTVSGATTSGDYRTGTTVTITAADPADGQRFKEWTVTGEGVTLDSATTATTTFTMPGNAVAVTANYEAVPVTTISFDATGGTGTMAEQKISEGTPQALNKNTFTWAGFSFARWDTKPDGTGTAYADGASFTATVDTTLYAQWTETTPAEPGYGVLRKDGVIYETNVGNTKTDGAVITDKTTVTHLYAADEVTSIGSSAFRDCSSLTTVDLPAVISIGSAAFARCSGLTTVNLPVATSIGVVAFYSCNALTTVNMPKVTTIGEEAFNGCKELITVNLPAATSIRDNAFAGCSGLVTVYLPAATSIGKEAFNGCQALTSVEVPAATLIDEQAFSMDDALVHINMAAVETINAGAFANCEKLETAEMPRATSIGEGGFETCVALTMVNMPKVTSIGKGAFVNNRALTKVEIPEVTSIGDWAFANCSALTTVEMPKVTSIGEEEFSKCPLLSNLTVGATPPTSVGAKAFEGCPSTTLSIAGGNTPAAVAAYEAADTSNPQGYWYGWALSYPLTVTKGTGSGDYRTGTTVTITAATPEAGQRFTNWTVAGDGVTLAKATDTTTTFTMPANAVAVTANYEAIPVTTISFDANEGTGTMVAQKISEGMPQALNENTFTWAGFSFARWDTKPDGTGTDYADGASFTASATTASVTLYAQWTETTPAVAGYGVLRHDGKVYTTNTNNTKTDGAEINIKTVKATVTHLYAADDVTSISDWKFCSCDVLTTVTMPKVTTIGKEAFNGCQALTSVEVPAVTLIDEQAFSMDDALVHINMAAVETINAGAFAHCEKLETVEMPRATSIGVGGFDTCVALTMVNMPKVTSIGRGAFLMNRALTTVEIPEVTSIGDWAFESCWALTTVEMPKVTSIGEQEFSQCPLLSNLTVGATPPTSVGAKAFEGCPSTTLTIAGGNTPAAVAAYEAADTSNPQGYWYGWALSYPLTVTNGTGSGDYRTGTTVTITAATPEAGQRFTNWTVAGDGVTLAKATDTTTTFTMPGNAVAVSANYEAIPVTSISYAANSGAGDMTSQQISAGSPQNLSANAFTRVGYSFKNWNTSADGSGTSYADSAQFSASVTENIILYAQWTDNNNTFIVSGTVADSKNQPVSGAEVKLMQGNVQIGVSVTTDANGGFTISNVPNGNYNLVVVSKNGDKDDIVVTTLVSVDNANYSVSSTIILPAGTMNSAVEVKADTPEIVVGNLENQFTAADKESAANGDLVEIKFTAEAKNSTAPQAGDIDAAAAATGKTVGMFIDFSVLKTINSSTPTPVPDLPDLIEVLIPLDPSLQGKTDYVIYRYHGSAVDTITTTEKDGEKIELIDGGKTIKLTAKKFSTYAVAYDEAVPDPGPGPSPSPVQTYTLTYNENSGTGTMKDQVFTEGTKQDLVKNTFERTGYTFAGWNTKQDGTGTAYPDGADFTAAATSTLYAQWTKNEITVPDGVTYRTHIQNIGWENTWAADGTRAGTEGQSLRLEGIEIKLAGDNLPAGAHIEYRTHIQNSGWENAWTSEGNIAGTVGQSLRLEAIQIRLVDMPGYSVEYRTHIQNRGWEPDWASDGESAGTEGQSLRLEAIEIRLVKTND
ncbi:leucine-rich repeat protein [Acetobacterium tundrae]|uniref:Leucine-rich repeat protein n=1 Tax=Acetobacterium tundrae TaxID=132932 RepID=A0ABR6WJA3_9FIRM|nr:leucine-rich repeat protein [Acetobacterium tundrae]MBC3796569.1 leucine-rich repeat protein [Acetobacterium tundrae]